MAISGIELNSKDTVSEGTVFVDEKEMHVTGGEWTEMGSGRRWGKKGDREH